MKPTANEMRDMRAHRSKRPTADHLLPATSLMRMCEGNALKQQLQTGARTLCHSIDYQQFGGCCNQTQYLIKLCTTKVPECPRSFRGAVSTTSGETTSQARTATTGTVQPCQAGTATTGTVHAWPLSARTAITDIVLVSCGFDACRGDPLGEFDVTASGSRA